jgi:hypothetical protein
MAPGWIFGVSNIAHGARPSSQHAPKLPAIASSTVKFVTRVPQKNGLPTVQVRWQKQAPNWGEAGMQKYFSATVPEFVHAGSASAPARPPKYSYKFIPPATPIGSRWISRVVAPKAFPDFGSCLNAT